MRDETEVLVLGGGPAGCAAARLLASWGHAVTLVTKPESADAPGLAESLIPSCGKLFDVLGIRDRIDGAGFVHSTGNTVWWGAGEPRVELFADGLHGWQVASTALERVMLTAAEEAGARIERRVIVPDEAAARPAAFRLDCTGRTGVLARARAGRVVEPGHRTVSLSATWRRPSGWPLPGDSHTVIESYADGWAWSVPLDPARRAVAVMVDPRTTALARGDGARSTYLTELDKTHRFRALLRDATLDSGPTGWDASMYSSARYAGRGWLVAGDAASFVDPLSSAGVKKALASGWLAAIATHTALATPSMADTALAFFADREAAVYRSFLALTRRYLRDAAVGQAHPFWGERAEASEWDERRDREDRERDAARVVWEELKGAPDLRVARGAAVCFEPRPAILGTQIVLERRLVTPDEPAGVRYLQDVDVVTLVEQAPVHRQVPDLFDAYVRHSGPADFAAFVTALATAIVRGWLVRESGVARVSGT